MESGGRSSSLGDLSGISWTARAEPGNFRSLVDVRPSTEHQLEDILDQGSPIGSASGDQALLDEDSDEHEDTDSTHAATADMVTPMTVDMDNTETQQGITQDPLYHQCKDARRSTFMDRLVSVAADNSFGSSVYSQSPPVGDLTDHDGYGKTFHGSRFKQGQVTVNQSVSFSFDPSSLLCVTCESGHTIIENKPVTVFFSDQNFIANLEGKNGSCLIIVRMENASLSELFELSKELFANVKFPEGSAFMYGSASYLSRAGCGMYAADWTSIVTHAEKVWYGVRVCPLIPLILTSCPGSLARELSEFAAWLSIVSEGNPLGLQATWGAVVSATEKLSVGGTALPTMDAYKVAVPKHWMRRPCSEA
jgi:hypothetical protein